ncbi:hypothetical protein LZ30DRAFT_94572 [Colletotrichum cereale]|nr:hypothetical protein LZ30DRAFT_94572 [Colletotrichum cereale]
MGGCDAGEKTSLGTATLAVCHFARIRGVAGWHLLVAAPFHGSDKTALPNRLEQRAHVTGKIAPARGFPRKEKEEHKNQPAKTQQGGTAQFSRKRAARATAAPSATWAGIKLVSASFFLIPSFLPFFLFLYVQGMVLLRGLVVPSLAVRIGSRARQPSGCGPLWTEMGRGVVRQVRSK